jgi:hypothetical protein
MTMRGMLAVTICCLALVGIVWSQSQDDGRASLVSSGTIKTRITNSSDVTATVALRTISKLLPSQMIGPGATATFESGDCSWVIEGSVTVNGRNVALKTMCMVFGSQVSRSSDCFAVHGAGVCYDSNWKVSSRTENGTTTYFFAKN